MYDNITSGVQWTPGVRHKVNNTVPTRNASLENSYHRLCAETEVNIIIIIYASAIFSNV